MKLQIFAIMLLTVGIMLFIVGFFLPPLAVIDGSSISAFGEILGAVSLLLAWHALDLRIDAKIRHGKTEIDIINDEDQEKGGQNANKKP